MSEPSNHTAARLLLLLAEFGESVSQAMKAATDEPDLVANTPILVLAILDLSGPQRPSDLARRTGLSTGGLSKVLDRMEEAGAVRRERRTVPGDRRGVLVSLTERGDTLLRTLTTELTRRLPQTRDLIGQINTVLEMDL